jgi:hypothetical protein
MEKLNISEILKDCPSGMELDCTMFDDVYFDYVDELNIIHCYIQHETYKTSVTFNLHGAYNSVIKSKCVIFPKGKTTWEGFQRPFKDGDIITCTNSVCSFVSIFKEMSKTTTFRRYVSFILNDSQRLYTKEDWADFKNPRFATEEEKETLFKAIKDNGYRWNAETKTLEKLEKEKFDITSLKPFDKVLVRDSNSSHFWEPKFFFRYEAGSDYPYRMLNYQYFNMCIPYEGNEHLLGTTNNCDDYYKTWK